jgi:hypothetical protein
MRLCFQLNEFFRIALLPADLYLHSTVRRLSDYVDVQQAGQSAAFSETQGFDTGLASAAQQNFFGQHLLNPANSFPRTKACN